MGKPVKTNSDGAARQRYLQKAAELMSGQIPVLAARYADCIRQLSKKTQVKIDKEFKRMLCKGCSSLLKPDKSADVRIFGKHRSQKKIGLTCHICGTQRSFLIADKPATVKQQKKKKKKIPKLNNK